MKILGRDARALSGLAAFREIEDEALRLIALSAEPRVLRSGDVLFRRREMADGALLILSGTVLLESASAPLEVGPGTLLGETALLVAVLRPATATTLGPVSVLRIPRALYLRVLGAYPDSARRVRQQVAARLTTMCDDYDAVGQRLSA